MNGRIATISRYPVKGLSAQDLPAVELVAGQRLPFDRRWALMHEAAARGAGETGWRAKSDFLTLVRHERLAALETEFDEETRMLVVKRNGRPVTRGRLDQPMGRTLVEQFFAAYMAGSSPGAPKLVEAEGFGFTDTKEPFVSLLNAASVRDLERVTKQPVDPRRFRANLLLDDLPAWEERSWVGRTLAIGPARLLVEEPTGRCIATDVDPATGERNLNIMQALRSGFSHTQCGVYARVVDGGRIAAGDAVTLV